MFKFLNLKTKTIKKAAFILGLMSIVSAGLGVLRDRLLAGRFGASFVLDSYYAAFVIPDFIDMVLIMGAISAAIIPVFSTYWAKNKNEARTFLGSLFLSLLISLIFVSFLAFVFASYLIKVVAPGFAPEEQRATVVLIRIMLLSPMLLGLSNIISAILQVFERFLLTALAPVLYNIGIILGILFLSPYWGAVGLAWGVVLGGFLHLIIQVPFFLKLSLLARAKEMPFKHPGVKKVVKLTLPRSLGLAASQLNFLAMTAIASTLTAGSIAVFRLSYNLSRPFIILLVVPLATAVFPKLSLDFARREKQKFLKNLKYSFHLSLSLILPASFLLLIFRQKLVNVIFLTGRFSQADARLTASSLGLFAVSLFAYGAGLILAKALYAMHNSKIPAAAAVISVLLNIFLALLLIFIFEKQNISPVLALPLSYSISGIVQFIILLLFTRFKIHRYGENN